MTEDNEYQKATKVVVDDAMRIDVLGPNVCKVLREHSPTSDQVKAIIVAAISGDTAVQGALAKFNEDQSITKKGKGLTNVQAIVLSAVLTVIVTLCVTALFNYFFGKPE